MKQAIVIRNDLNMTKGKLAAQAAHASLSAYKKCSLLKQKTWEFEGQKKVVLKINSEEELIQLKRKCSNEKIPCEIIKDAGKTQIAPGTYTSLGIGPDKDEIIDKITGHLKLY
jgi:peptidyl-tRNA hydrolase, PTH2 family